MQIQFLHPLKAIELVSSCQFIHGGKYNLVDFWALTDLLFICTANFALFLLLDPSLDQLEVRHDNRDQIRLQRVTVHVDLRDER